MDELVKKEFNNTLEQINKCFGFIIDDVLPTNEIIKLEFKSIRILTDYCEKLALEGVSAIETI